MRRDMAVVPRAPEFSMWCGTELPEEAASLGPVAVPKRRREFTAGRNCARRGLEALGLRGVPIPSGPFREPQWPPGVVGSITHCAGYCAAAVARRDRVLTIGIDAEPNVPLLGGVGDLVCTERERAWITSQAEGEGDLRWDALVFSAKESVYKAWFSLERRWLGFEEAELEIDTSERSFLAHLAVAPRRHPLTGRLAGRFGLAGGRVFTAVVVPAPEAGDLVRDAAAAAPRERAHTSPG
jgi:4'-phosphopantetheinyl transferase EntD